MLLSLWRDKVINYDRKMRYARNVGGVLWGMFDLDLHSSLYMARGKRADQNMPMNAAQEFND